MTDRASDSRLADREDQFLTISVAGQTLGIPVLTVHDVLGPQRITRIPLAPHAVLGSLNLRGRIVTAIDVRQTLGFAGNPAPTQMCVVVEHHGELYSLAIDSVGEVVSLAASDLVPTPLTLAPVWHEVAKGVCRTPERLLIILDVGRLLAGLAEQESGVTALAA